jgi:hypothetical protein
MTGLKCYASDDNSPFAASESERRPHRSKITTLDSLNRLGRYCPTPEKERTSSLP